MGRRAAAGGPQWLNVHHPPRVHNPTTSFPHNRARQPQAHGGPRQSTNSSREVATLLNDEKLVGVYTVRWETNGLASGIYFYRLQAGGFAQTTKMLLAR
jgi:hypothetical protein